MTQSHDNDGTVVKTRKREVKALTPHTFANIKQALAQSSPTMNVIVNLQSSEFVVSTEQAPAVRKAAGALICSPSQQTASGYPTQWRLLLDRLKSYLSIHASRKVTHRDTSEKICPMASGENVMALVMLTNTFFALPLRTPT
jgi:hypothetical protein